MIMAVAASMRDEDIRYDKILRYLMLIDITPLAHFV